MGGTAKRLARRASLQFDGTSGFLINTPLSLFEWCNANIQGIKFFYVTKENCEENKTALLSRFESAKTIDGTQSYHAFIPIDDYRIEAKIMSADESGDIKFIKKLPVENHVIENPVYFINVNEIVVGSILAFLSGGVWHLGKVTQVLMSEFKVTLFTPDGCRPNPSGFMLSRDKITVYEEDILMDVKSLNSKTPRSRRYVILESDKNLIDQRFKERINRT